MIMQKVNIDYWYRTEEFDRAIRYANENKEVKDVDQILDKVQKSLEQYRGEMLSFLQQIRTVTDEKYDKWSLCHKAFTISKWVSIASIIMFFWGIKLSKEWLTVISVLVLLFALVLTGAFKVAEILTGKLYTSYINEKEREAGMLCARYDREAKAFYIEIDNAYLRDLDPAYREMILMRRDQERQHQELLRSQERHQQIMEREQRQARQAQQELLRIEREREERYRRRY